LVHPLAQFADVFGVVLISSFILSIITIALTIKILLLTDVSRPWRIAGLGLILSMVATIILELAMITGMNDTRYYPAFYVCYLISGILIYTALRRLARSGDKQPGLLPG